MESSMKVPVAFVLILTSLSATSALGETVTEGDAIRLFLETSPRALAIPLIEQSVSAELRRDAPVANPTIAYQIEDAAGVRDDFLTFQQELPITGRRGRTKDAAEAASRAAGLAAERDLRSDAHELRASFSDVLYRELALDRLRREAGLLDGILEILRRREREGEGSGYDLLRAEQEQAALRIETAGAEVALSSARSRFGSFFDPSVRMETATLEGDIETTSPIPDTDGAIELAFSQRTDLQALVKQEESLELERQAGRKKRFPEPTLMAGWKRTQLLGLDDTGYIAALSLPLPIFDRGKVSVERAAADRQRLELEAEILRREIRAEVLAALARERSARDVARPHGDEIERRAGKLRTIARLRYDEGEGGILELLDAHRTALAMELLGLAARYEARAAEIERDRAIGNEVKP